jgi:thiamine-phosphate pyrophosphorylase
MDSGLYRILDANANRAREGLRVLEDYARFVLNDDETCRRIKSLRHDVSASLSAVLTEAILHRDTPGDVGTATTTASESNRQGKADVITAAGKRLGEALRVMEEVFKTVDPSRAESIKQARYRFYDLEQTLARTLRPNRFHSVRLYVLITESTCKQPWFEAAQQAIAGGADCLQLREKNLDSGELLARAIRFVKLCRDHRVLSIINDRPIRRCLADH